MTLSGVAYLIGDAAKSIRRNGLMSLAALSAVTVSLTVFGGALFGLYRLHQFVASQPERFEIAVFLRPELPREVSLELERKIRGMPGVAGTTLVTKEEALQTLMEQDRRRGTRVTAALAGANPLPDRIDVRVVSPERSREVASSLRSSRMFPEIECVNDERELLDKLMATSRLVRTISAVLAVLVLLATGVMIQNTLRLTVIARQDEIRIMRLVGASPAFIRIPILLEGIFYGVAGAAIAAGLVLVLVAQTSRYAAQFQTPLAEGLPPAPGAGAVFAFLVATGLALGALMSVISIRRFLR